MLSGSCLCGAIRYEIDGDLGPIEYCHCSQCRKASGSAFASNATVAADAFRVTAGHDRLREYESTPGKLRGFCGTCGSPLYARFPSGPDLVRIRVGTVTTVTQSKASAHFHVASKSEWYEIADDLPNHDGEIPGAFEW